MGLLVNYTYTCTLHTLWWQVPSGGSKGVSIFKSWNLKKVSVVLKVLFNFSEAVHQHISTQLLKPLHESANDTVSSTHPRINWMRRVHLLNEVFSRNQCKPLVFASETTIITWWLVTQPSGCWSSQILALHSLCSTQYNTLYMNKLYKIYLLVQ